MAVRRGARHGPAGKTEAVAEVAIGKQQSEAEKQQARNAACGTVRGGREGGKGDEDTETEGQIREDQGKY